MVFATLFAFALSLGSLFATVVIPDPTVDPIGFVTQLFGAGRSGGVALIASIVLVGLVSVLRKFGAKYVEKLAGERAAPILNFLSGFAPALAAGIASNTAGVLGYFDVLGTAILAGTAVAGLAAPAAAAAKVAVAPVAKVAQLVKPAAPASSSSTSAK